MKDLDTTTMRAVGFEPDGQGGYKRTAPTPARPGKAIRKALTKTGLIFRAEREAKDT